jgi:hypothetical protein
MCVLNFFPPLPKKLSLNFSWLYKHFLYAYFLIMYVNFTDFLFALLQYLLSVFSLSLNLF